MRLTTRDRRVVVALAVLAVLGGALTLRTLLRGTQEAAGAAIDHAPQPLPHIPRPAWGRSVAAPVDGPLVVVTESRTNAVVEEATRTFLRSAPVVVLAPSDDAAGIAVADRLGERLRAPVLPVSGARRGGPLESTGRAAPAGSGTAALLRELGTRSVIAVGSARAPRGPHDLRRVPLPADLRDVRDLLAQATRRADAQPADRAVVLVRTGDAAGRLAAAAARSAGHEVVETPVADPRADPAVQRRLAQIDADDVVLLGSHGAWADVDPAELTWQLAVARRGLELPGGGQLLFPARRLVALYGNPEGPALGVLGEQGVEAAIERARALAETYATISEAPVVPTFEIIATVASAAPGPTGDWSRRSRRDILEHWVDAAEEAGVYVVLDLQPGTTDLLTQAREFEDLLARPHVGLALDPEWRLAPGQRHLRQIGSVSAAEVNRVADWLSELVRTHALPQKLLLVHQFKLSMIRDRATLDTDHPELAVAIQMDGQGGQGVKLDTWRTITTTAPPDGLWWGWKNFYDEDPTVRSPTDVLSLEPSPMFVSYQ